jgi:hypothetical protein
MLAMTAIDENKMMKEAPELEYLTAALRNAIGRTCTNSGGARERIFSLLSHFSKCLFQQYRPMK